MAKTLKAMREAVRNHYFDVMVDYFKNEGEDVQITKSNTFAFPIVLEDGTEDYIRVVVSIPTGTKADPYDAHEEAKTFKMETERKAREKAEREAKKKAKAEADARKRAKAKEKAE